MKKVFEAKIFDIYEKPVNGTTYNIVHRKKEAVVILATTTEGKILVVSQYRPAIDKTILELPAGMIDDGEKPEDAAVRELNEETGFAAHRATPRLIMSYYSSPGFTDERHHLVFVDGVVKVPPEKKLKQDENENVSFTEMTPEEFAKAKFEDGKSNLAKFLWLSNIYLGEIEEVRDSIKRLFDFGNVKL